MWVITVIVLAVSVGVMTIVSMDDSDTYEPSSNYKIYKSTATQKFTLTPFHTHQKSSGNRLIVILITDTLEMFPLTPLVATRLQVPLRRLPKTLYLRITTKLRRPFPLPTPHQLIPLKPRNTELKNLVFPMARFPLPC